MSTIKELRERIADLEREVQYYRDIAATYRHALGDAKANTILLPFFEMERICRMHRKERTPTWALFQESRQP